MYFLIAHTANRTTVGLMFVVAVHSGVSVAQAAVISAVATVLGSAPKVGADAETEVAAVVAASG